MGILTEAAEIIRGRNWWSIGGALIGTVALGWVLWRVDYGRLQGVIIQANVGFLLLVPLTIAAEQWVRAWKWRQLLYGIRPIPTLRLFGAIMAGYFANILVPLGISPIVRSWLVARSEELRMGTVLATAAIDRLVDGVIFTGFVAFAIGFAVFPDPDGDIHLGLVVGGIGSLVLFGLLLFLLARWKQQARHPGGWVERLGVRMPARFSGPVKGFLQSFTEGIVWPDEIWRTAGIIIASIGIKLVATTYFLWAGLAFGVALRPTDYVFLLVFLGFLIILTRFARIPGGFLVGGVFALNLLGVAEEQSLAMVLLVHFASLITVSSIGAFALWQNGVAIADLRSIEESGGGHS
ncbi:MAG: flippase-like domain-containing protein [Rhodospirillales bacterium]|nr:flippase-like domain-containing protein [Rhodospirillales bacterium]